MATYVPTGEASKSNLPRCRDHAAPFASALTSSLKTFRALSSKIDFFSDADGQSMPAMIVAVCGL
jgi:hypothetical protein